ncbi:MAG: cell wall hydrolase [Holosporaceae bacterium]|jgi:spore germination cell wall hydrolase CwlJ-like protein|nr:cell wall hydrolase [Holosporaceae bacterium]
MKFSKIDLDTLAKTIYGEGRGELYRFGLSSLIAIANVVINRKNKRFAQTVSAVCLAPYQFSCWDSKDANYTEIKKVTEENAVFKACLRVAYSVLSEKWPDLTDGCDHYHERSVKPFWAAYMEPKRIFGSHCFYELVNRKRGE